MKRPNGVTLCGVLFLTAAIVSIVGGVSFDTELLSDVREFLERVHFYQMFPKFMDSMSSLISLWGVVVLVASIGMIEGIRIGRQVMIAMLFIEVAVIMAQVVEEPDRNWQIAYSALLGILGILLYYLYRPHVRAYFERRVVVNI